MGKIYKTSDDIVELVESKFDETGLDTYGLNLRVMSVNKSKDLIKVSKANAATEFLVKDQDIIQVFIYEAAFDRLPDDAKNMLVEMALSNISYNSEKDKIIIDNNPFNQIFAMRKKYGDVILDKIELASMIMAEIEAENKEKKETNNE